MYFMAVGTSGSLHRLINKYKVGEYEVTSIVVTDNINQTMHTIEGEKYIRGFIDSMNELSASCEKPSVGNTEVKYNIKYFSDGILLKQYNLYYLEVRQTYTGDHEIHNSTVIPMPIPIPQKKLNKVE